MQEIRALSELVQKTAKSEAFKLNEIIEDLRGINGIFRELFRRLDRMNGSIESGHRAFTDYTTSLEEEDDGDE